MLPWQLKCLRQQRRHRTTKWKQQLDRRLHLQETVNVLLDSTLSSFAFIWHALVITISALPEALARFPSTGLQPMDVGIALLSAALQVSGLCGAIARESSPSSFFPLFVTKFSFKQPSFTLR
jgi:hypothetical protein